MNFYPFQTFAIGSLCLVAASTLQAQFLSTNSREAVGYAVALEQGHLAVSSAVDFARANAHSANGAALGYSFSNLETDRTGQRPFDSEVDQQAVHLNYGHAFGHGLVAALQLSYFDSEAESIYPEIPGKVEFDSDGWLIASTIAYALEGFDFAFVAGLGGLSSDTSRVGSITTPKEGDTDTDFYTLGVNVDYTIYQQDALTITPRVGLNYTKVDVDPITETTAPADSGVLDSMDREWLIASLELIFGWEANEKLKLNAALGWHYDFENDETTLSGVDSGGAGSITLPDVGESVFKGGLSANYALDDNWSLGADVNIYSGDDLNGVSLGAVLAYRF